MSTFDAKAGLDTLHKGLCVEVCLLLTLKLDLTPCTKNRAEVCSLLTLKLDLISRAKDCAENCPLLTLKLD